MISPKKYLILSVLLSSFQVKAYYNKDYSVGSRLAPVLQGLFFNSEFFLSVSGFSTNNKKPIVHLL
jgi:hypothetical protein